MPDIISSISVNDYLGQMQSNMVNQKEIDTLMDNLDKLLSFKQLEKLCSKIKAQLIKRIASQPLMLQGCDSEYFYKQVGFYLQNSKNANQQSKYDYCEAYYLDGAVGFSQQDKDVIQGYVKQFEEEQQNLQNSQQNMK